MENITEPISMSRIGPENNRRANIMKKTLLVLLCAVLAFNQLFIINIETKLKIGGFLTKEINNVFYPSRKNAIGDTKIVFTGNIQSDALAMIMIKGEPAAYGKELHVSFEGVQESMDIMKKYDPRMASFNKNELERYLNVTGKISCEFCCTVKSLTTSDGSPTCNCDHAKAMRGLAAYLVKNHGNEFDDEAILKELARWKGVYFPRQMTVKLIGEIRTGVYSPDVNALLNGIKLPEYDFTNYDQDEMEKIPDMVGGC